MVAARLWSQKEGTWWWHGRGGRGEGSLIALAGRSLPRPVVGRRCSLLRSFGHKLPSSATETPSSSRTDSRMVTGCNCRWRRQRRRRRRVEKEDEIDDGTKWRKVGRRRRWGQKSPRPPARSILRCLWRQDRTQERVTYVILRASLPCFTHAEASTSNAVSQNIYVFYRKTNIHIHPNELLFWPNIEYIRRIVSPKQDSYKHSTEM